MSIEPEHPTGADHSAALVAAAGLVATKVMDCLLQTLMNKELLLPLEVNDIYRAADLLIAQAEPAGEYDEIVHRLARVDLADRLGEDYGERIAAFTR